MSVLLLDTNVLVPVSRGETQRLPAAIATLIGGSGHALCASVASLWEIAIKARLGKLDPGMPLRNLPPFFAAMRFRILGIDEGHALAELSEEPPTRDPFDRMLLAQCQVEGMQLVTRDAALAGHVLAWRG